MNEVCMLTKVYPELEVQELGRGKQHSRLPLPTAASVSHHCVLARSLDSSAIRARFGRQRSMAPDIYWLA